MTGVCFMRFGILFLFLMLVLQCVSVSAQSDSSQGKICYQPFSYKFDEFNISNIEDAKKRLKDFAKKLNGESDEAKGVIIVYGGKQTRINEAEQIISELGKILDVNTDYKAKIQGLNGGYRNLPSVELYIKPLECSKFPDLLPDFDIDQVQFAEAPIESTVRKTSAQMSDSLIKKTPVQCSPASKAVGACKEFNSVEVFVIIDRIGNVIFSKTISGHPLLRANAEKEVKNWKYKPTEINGKKFNVVGRIKVDFEKPEPPSVDY